MSLIRRWKQARRDRQAHYVELLEEAYATHPFPDYKARLERARRKLAST